MTGSERAQGSGRRLASGIYQLTHSSRYITSYFCARSSDLSKTTTPRMNSPDGGARGPYSVEELVGALKYAAAPDISVEINQCSSRGTENYNLQTQARS